MTQWTPPQAHRSGPTTPKSEAYPLGDPAYEEYLRNDRSEDPIPGADHPYSGDGLPPENLQELLAELGGLRWAHPYRATIAALTLAVTLTSVFLKPNLTYYSFGTTRYLEFGSKVPGPPRIITSWSPKGVDVYIIHPETLWSGVRYESVDEKGLARLEQEYSRSIASSPRQVSPRSHPHSTR